MTRTATRLVAAAAATGVFGLAGATLAAEVDGPKVNWNFSLWGNPRAFTKGPEEVSRLVAEKTGGNFQIKISYGEALSKSRENLDGIKLGAFEVAAFCNFYHPGKNPAFMVMSLPFLPLKNPEVHQQVAEALFRHPAAIADMDRWNARLYMSSLLPQYEFLGRGEPPMKLEDWNGKRVRAGGGIGRAMEKLGAIRTTVPAPEVYTVIERGTVDAVSFPFTYAHFAYKVHEVTTWYTTNLQPGTSECPTVFNKDAWAALPAQYQKLLEDVKQPAYEAMKKAYSEIDKKNLPVLQETLTPVTYSAAELARFREVAGDPVWAEFIEDNKDKFDARALIDYVVAAADKALQTQ